MQQSLLLAGLCSALWRGRRIAQFIFAALAPCPAASTWPLCQVCPQSRARGAQVAREAIDAPVWMPRGRINILMGMSDTGWFSWWLAAHKICLLSWSRSSSQRKFSLHKLEGHSRRKAQRKSYMPVSVLILVKPLFVPFTGYSPVLPKTAANLLLPCPAIHLGSKLR